MDKKEAMEVFDGLMLGDAGLVPNGDFAYFKIALSAGDPEQWKDTLWSGRESRVPQIQYLWHIHDCLQHLGIEFSNIWPKAEVRIGSTGKPYLYCGLQSFTSDFLLTQWKKWYRPVTDEVRKTRWFADNRKWYKVLPGDTTLTPLTTAVWFEGDGSTRWCPRPWVMLKIHTNNFTRNEVKRLSGLLLSLGVQTHVYQQSSKRQLEWLLVTNAVGSVNSFFCLTEKYIHSCYQYKVKKAKYASECATEEEKRNVCNLRNRVREWRKKDREPDLFFSNLRSKLKGEIMLC